MKKWKNAFKAATGKIEFEPKIALWKWRKAIFFPICSKVLSQNVLKPQKVSLPMHHHLKCDVLRNRKNAPAVERVIPMLVS